MAEQKLLHLTSIKSGDRIFLTREGEYNVYCGPKIISNIFEYFYSIFFPFNVDVTAIFYYIFCEMGFQYCCIFAEF